MKELLKRHYEAIVSRGLISPDTTLKDFIFKIMEEDDELLVEYMHSTNMLTSNAIQEAIDLIMVTANMLQHYGVDIEKELLISIEKQEKRAKDGH